MPRHCPFWCEENCWHLAGDPEAGPGERRVLLLSGASGHVACWAQRAAEPGEVVLWDYHAVLAVDPGDGWRIWDLDSRLGCPVPAERWLAGTFPIPGKVPEPFAPRFALVPAADFRRDFASDRSHMRTADGAWQHPPPEWPAITGGTVPLAEWLRRARCGLDLAGLAAALGLSRGQR